MSHHLTDVERQVVAGVWDDPDFRRVVLTLVPDDFQDPVALAGYEALAEAARGEVGASHLRMRDIMSRRGCSDEFVELLHHDCVTPSEHRVGMEIVRRAGIRRRVLRALRVVFDRVRDEGYDLEVAQAFAAEVLAKAFQGVAEVRAYSLRDTLNALGDAIQNARCRVVGTGLGSLDALCEGMGAQELILLAARPGMGKSALALQLALHVAAAHGPVLYWSGEMSRMHIARRVVAQRMGGPSNRIRAVQAYMQADQAPALHLLDNACDLRQLVNQVEQFRFREPELKLVVVDYLGLLGQNNYESVSEVSKGLLALAKRLDTPVLALHQLSRSLEFRNDKRPQLSDLRDSGQLEQDAHKVWMLFRPVYYKKDFPDPKEAWIFVRKNREGRTGGVKVAWEANDVRFQGTDYVSP